jgi:hypothetical protein
LKKKQNRKLSTLTRSNLKTPKFDIKKKAPKLPKVEKKKIEDPLIAQSLQKFKEN